MPSSAASPGSSGTWAGRRAGTQGAAARTRGRASRRRAPSASAPARRLRRPCSCRAVPTNEALEFLQHVAPGSAGERDGVLGGQEVTFERCRAQVADRSGLLDRKGGGEGKGVA